MIFFCMLIQSLVLYLVYSDNKFLMIHFFLNVFKVIAGLKLKQVDVV